MTKKALFLLLAFLLAMTMAAGCLSGSDDDDSDGDTDGDTTPDGDDNTPDGDSSEGCSGACDTASDAPECVDSTKVCYCDNGTWTEYLCATVCAANTSNGKTEANGCGMTEYNGQMMNWCICVAPSDGDEDGDVDGDVDGDDDDATDGDDTPACAGACDPETYVTTCLSDATICGCGEDNQLAAVNCDDVCAEDTTSYFGICDYYEDEQRDVCMCSPYPEGNCKYDSDCVGHANGPNCVAFEEGWFCGECASDEDCTNMGKDQCMGFTDGGNPPELNTTCVKNCTIDTCGTYDGNGAEIGCTDWGPIAGQTLGLCTDMSPSGEDATCTGGQTGCGGDANNFCMALNIGSYCWGRCTANTAAATECGANALCLGMNASDTGALMGGFCLDLAK